MIAATRLASNRTQAAQYVATALAPLVLGGHLALGPLLASPCEGLMEGGKAAEFAVFAVKQVRVERKLWGCYSLVDAMYHIRFI